MADNTVLFKTLEQTLQQFHPALLQKLNNGISENDIKKIASGCQVSLTGDVCGLFAWKNGVTRKTGDVADALLMFPDGVPFSLADAATAYNLLSLTKNLFEANYFPLFSGNNGNLLLMDLDSCSPTFQSISLYSPTLLGSATPMTIYDSLSSMMETAVACYQQGAFRIDQDTLQVNSDTHYSIASGMNPESQYWQFM